ncbi:MAG: RNA polymerase sigma factor [bacterium]
MKQSITDWSNEKLEREIRRNPNDSCLWNELFTRLKRQLFPRALRTCNGNVHEAEEIVQEAFLALVERLSEIERWKSLTAYAHGIMRNKCSQWIKRKAPEYNGDYNGQFEPNDQTVHDEVFKVIKAFFKRKSMHWEIIRLKMFDKLSHADIAMQLGIREGASRARLHKAVTALRKLCDKHNITSEEFKGAIKRYYYEMPEQE